MGECKKMRKIQLKALQADIRAGLESGPVELLDMAEVKAAARKRRSQNKRADG